MAEKMTPERLAEIRADHDKYGKHARYGEHELSALEIDRLELDDFPKYVGELIAHIDAQEAELTALRAAARAVVADDITRKLRRLTAFLDKVDMTLGYTDKTVQTGIFKLADAIEALAAELEKE